MKDNELCLWLRENSSGIYRPAAQAAERIEELRKALLIIEIWARHDSPTIESRKKAVDDIKKAARRALDLEFTSDRKKR